jgi:DNA-binding PadR family transcriptional regulator
MNINRFLPLQEPTLYILLSLRGGGEHGYAILKDIAELSDGRVRLSTGTLYGALYRLLDQGLIEQIESKNGARGKKVYQLTRSGLEVFDAEVNRMKQVLLVVTKKVDMMEGCSYEVDIVVILTIVKILSKVISCSICRRNAGGVPSWVR